MKLLFTLFTSTSILISCTKTDIAATETTNMTRIYSNGPVNNPVYAHFSGHSDKHKCVWGYGDCLLAITSKASATQKEGEWPISINLINSSQLKVTNTSTLKSDDDILDIPATGLAVPSDICRQLGVYAINIVPGSYKVQYDENRFGAVLFTINVK